MSEFNVNLPDSPIGASITGLNAVESLRPETFAKIDKVLNERAVVAIRGQSPTGRQLVAFARQFGTIQVNVRTEITDGQLPEITYISNVFEDGRPLGSHDAGTYWHSDLCYLAHPSKLTLLYALEVPRRNAKSYGDTQFAGMASAYDALDESVKRRLEGMQAANGYRYMWNKKARQFGKRAILSDAELAARYPPDAVHPVVRTHPVNGRKCLYINEGYTRCLVGLPPEQSDALLAELLKHVTRPEFIYRHQWQIGDILIWDNCAVQHKATFDYEPPMRRLMQRCVIEGEAPL